MKKIVWIIVCCVLSIFLVSCKKTEKTFTFTQLEDGTYELTRVIDESLTRVKIPKKYKGEPVTKISNEAFDDITLESVFIPSTISVIEANAFMCCSTIQHVDIESLESWCNIEFENIYSNPMSQTKNIYHNGKKLNMEILKLPKGITHIKPYALMGKIYSVQLPSSLQSLDEDAISSQYLVEIINKSSVEDAMIADTFSTPPLTIHKDDTIIDYEGDYVFCSINDKNYLLGYRGDDLVISLPESYNGENYTIRSYAFQGTKVLSITILNGCEEIEEYGLSGVVELANLSNLKTGGRLVTYVVDEHTGNSKMEKEGDFYFYSSRDYYYLVAYVGKSEDVKLPALYKGQKYGVFAIGSYTKVKKVHIPESVDAIGGGALALHSLEEITVDVGNPVYKSMDGVLYSIDGKRLIQYPAGKKDSSFIVPTSVTIIEERAFMYSSSLKDITFSPTLKTINIMAFWFCKKLESITLPEGFEELDSSAISYCKNLRYVNIPSTLIDIGSFAFSECQILNFNVAEDNKYYKSIDGHLFSKSGESLIRYATRRSDTYYEVPDGVTSISVTAFEDCKSLRYVLLPETLESMSGSNPFRGCSNIKAIYYEGTQEQWAEMTILDREEIEEYDIYFYSSKKPTVDGLFWYYAEDKTPRFW